MFLLLIIALVFVIVANAVQIAIAFYAGRRLSTIVIRSRVLPEHRDAISAEITTAYRKSRLRPPVIIFAQGHDNALLKQS